MRPTKEQVRQLEWQSLILWELDATFPQGDATPEEINLRCVSSTVPKKENKGNLEVEIRGHTVPQAGVWDSAGEITLTFNETEDVKIRSLIKNLIDKMCDPNTKQMVPLDEYMSDNIVLVQLDKSDDPIWHYKLKGAFISDYDIGGELGGDHAVQAPTITIRYNAFEDGPGRG